MSRETILVVDDDFQITELLAHQLLPGLGYVTLVAHDGQTALEIVRQDQPDLILLDLRLPDISGIEVLRQLADEGRSIPTILFTAYGSEQVAVDAFRLGVQDYLIKPVELETLSEAVTHAFEETRLRREKASLAVQLQQQVTRLMVLSKVGQSVTSSLELDKVLHRIVEAGVFLTQADEGFLALVDHQTDQLYLRAARNIDQDESQILQRKVSDSLIGEVLRTGHLLRMVRNPEEQALKVSTGFLVHSLLYVPILSRGKVLGVLGMDNRVSERDFGEMDEKLLFSLADYAAVALENANLYAETDQQLKELQLLHNAGRTILSTLDLNQRLTHIVEEITSRMGTQVASILLLDKETDELVFEAVAGPKAEELRGFRLAPGQGAAGYVAREGKSLLVPDVQQSPLFDQSIDESSGFVTRSMVCAPLTARGEIIGVIQVLNKEVETFDESDLRVLEALAGFAAVAIENARFYDVASRRAAEATAYAQDLEALHQEERRQREALARLRSSFLNAIGHELTTPISIMMQNVETLSDSRRGALSHEQEETVETLRQQALRLQRMISTLITFAGFAAKQDDIEFYLTPLDAVLDDALQLANFKTQRREVELEDCRPEGLPSLMVDGERLSEALVNLLDNAIRFSPPRAPVILSGKVHPDSVEISVQDFGPGIPKDEQEHIWEAFSQLNQSLQRGLEGLGLGLAMTRHIVEAHSGTVSVDSTVDHGSTFTITLPRERKGTGLLVSPFKDEAET